VATSNDQGRRTVVQYGDQRVERGHGGETHQIAAGSGPRLTTQEGTVVSNDQNTLRAGERGPSVLEDSHFREKIFHFDHERIPERVVHARGYGAHGFFENYEPLTDLTRADPFSEAGLRTPVFVRFSTVAGNKDSPDLARDVRGFATKFYTREGNWDLVGNNIPVFFILDPTKIVPEEEVPVRRVGRLVLDRVVDNFFAETEQVAFCTQNIIPGIDFTNDPLLQGRNFSYLDTQVKRLGGPNFTHLPVNAPKCPIAHFQRDGHMAMMNPQGRVNYEPNSWDPPGPREDPAAGFRTYPDGQGDQAGPKRRLRPESFADHYSQAGQFFISQTDVEQQHIIDAFVFELSKCDKPAIRSRMVAALRNVDRHLARSVADGLGLAKLPEALAPARKPVRDLASPALSILANGPDSFAGRKLGILVTDGADAAKLAELTAAAEEAKVNVELIALAVGGVEASDGHQVPADQKIDGGPSVLYDAVIVLAARDGAEALAVLPAARDFVTDAYAHCKFVGYTGDAAPLFEAAGLSRLLDDGFISLDETGAAEFISRCVKLRFWPASSARPAPGLVDAEGDNHVTAAVEGPVRRARQNEKTAGSWTGTEGPWRRQAPEPAPGRSGTACSASISTIISRARPQALSSRTGWREPIACKGKTASSSAWRPRSRRTAQP
jgi:catalase/putative intracellular protease/amidase